MHSPAEMAERHGRMLAELAELGLGLARDLQGRALAAETPQEAAQLADAFHRMSRSVRQSLALEAKLARDAVHDARARCDLDARETAARKSARKVQLEKRAREMIWREVDPPAIAGDLVRDLPELLEREAESETFLDEPVELQIARIREILGLDEDWADEEPGEAATADTTPRPPPDPPRPPSVSGAAPPGFQPLRE